MRAAILFQLASAALVYFAAREAAWRGVLAALAVITVELWLTKKRARLLEAMLCFGVAGALCESALLAAGVVSFTGWNFPWLCPPWAAVLWALMGTLAHGAFAPLTRRPLLGAAMGALFGPLSFFAAEAAGAIVIARPLVLSIPAMSLSLALTLGVAFAGSKKTETA